MAGGILREASAVEREVVDRLRGLAIEPPGASGA